MNDKGISQHILSDAIEKVINKRKVKAAVFLTFQFDPGFFEEEILPLFFNSSFSHNPKVRLVQLEDLVRGIEHLAVYYDRKGLTTDAQPSRLDYKRIGLSRNTGFFHPKNIFILVENQEEDSIWDSLITVTMSANLTRSGWWENLECVYINEVNAEEKCSYRGDILELIKLIKKEDKTGDNGEALEVIRKFVVYKIYDTGFSKKDGRWFPSIYYGQSDFPTFLSDFLRGYSDYNLEIISPFFDNSENASALVNLLDQISPKEVRVFIPEGKGGEFLCKEEFYSAVKNLSKVKWARLPKEITARSTSEKNVDDRFVHAKVYRFWSQTDNWEIYFIGSLNLTNAAHQSVKGGNFEIGILVEPEVKGRLTWWLTPIDEPKKIEFKVEKDTVSESDKIISNLSIKFAWNNDSSEYFWQSDSDDSVKEVQISCQGVVLFDINPIVYNRWKKLPAEYSEKIKEKLPSTSFFDITLKDGRSQKILVREEGMAKKPSIIDNLTVEEILMYWSFLSPEQKEFLLQKKVAEKFGLSEYVSDPSTEKAPDSMFDKFAGIFHAFGRLKNHILDAIKNNRFNEATYRLFGEKYDSLPTLIDKVLTDDKSDNVNKYLTLLCASQLITHIEKNEDFTLFKQAHSKDFQAINSKLLRINDLKEQFEFDSLEERQKFFDWFEDMFMLEIPVKEEIED